MSAPPKPFLMFVGDVFGKAEEAISLYTGLFPNSRIVRIEKYGPGELGPEGSVKRALFVINGQEHMAMDSAAPHAFTFTPAVSFFVNCESIAELDGFIAALAQGGKMLMEPANYGFSQKFAWLNDRYGVSWQFNCA